MRRKVYVGKAAIACLLLVAIVALWFVASPSTGSDPVNRAAPIAKAPTESSQDAKHSQAAFDTEAQRAEAVAALSPATAEESTAAQSYAITARFVDAQGAPIFGAELSAPQMDKPSSATSGEDGRVRLVLGWPFLGRKVGVNEFRLRARGPGLAMNAWYAKVEGPGEQALGDIRMQLGGSVRGRVVDSAGRPFAGARVSPLEAFLAVDAADLDQACTFGTNTTGVNNGDWFDFATGADGAYQCDGVLATRVSMAATARGHLRAIGSPIAITAGGAVVAADLVLEEPTDANRIAGVVLNAQDGPLANIHVSLDDVQRRPLPGGVTGSDGHFELLVPRNASYSLFFSREQSSVDGVRVETVAAGTTNLIVRFAPERWVEVVARAPDGTAIPARVSLSRSDGYGLRARVEAADAGAQRLQVPETAFFVYVAAEGWRADPQGPFEPASAPAALTFALRRATGIAGRVLADGKPVSGVRVHAHSPCERGGAGISDDGFHARIDSRVQGQALTNVDGQFFVPLSRSGGFTLHAEGAGYARGESGPVNYNDGTNAEGVEIALGHGGSIEGRVLTAEGIEAAGTIVGVGCGDTHVATQRVGEDATFRFDNLTPGRWQVLRCDPELLTRLEGGMYLYARADELVHWSVDVRAGEASHFDLDLRSRIPCHLRGQLLVDGVVPAGWRCNLGTKAHFVGGVLDAEGRFELASEEPGEHWLNLFGPENSPVRVRLHQTVQLAPGENMWSVAIRTGQVVIDNMPRLQVDREREEKLPHYVLVAHGDEGLDWKISIDSAEPGSLTIGAVPVGTVKLLARPLQTRRSYPDESWPVVGEFVITANVETHVILP